MQQGTQEWHEARAGRVTASRISDVLAKTRNGPSASRADYIAQLVAERITGKKQDTFTSQEMTWGTEAEPLARAAYEAEYGLLVTEVGFIQHPRIEMSGASPDGMVSIDGLIEIKAPKTKTHIDTMLSGEAPAKYIPQMQWQMACTGRAWVDFVSFDPRMPADMQMFVRRVLRDDNLIREYEAEVIRFLAEVDETVSRLKAMKAAA